jgi:hypothetical protein
MGWNWFRNVQHRGIGCILSDYIFSIFRVEPTTPEFSYQATIRMTCMTSLCNGGNSLNKINELVYKTFPLVEVDLSNANPTSGSNPILQEMRLGCLSLLVLLMVDYLFH